MNPFTADLISILLSNPISGINVDKSGPIIEVVGSSYYIVLDLLSQTPTNIMVSASVRHLSAKEKFCSTLEEN